MNVAIFDEPFKNLAAYEQASVLATSEHYFFGLKMQQHPQAVIKLNQLLNAIRPRHIIEIGAGNCGLSYLFALYANITGGSYMGFDLIQGKHASMLNQHLGGFLQKDVLNDAGNVEALKQRIAADGRVLLVCDAGKALEFNLYASSLKVGDFVITHDFAPDRETFERDIKGKVWDWHENWYERIAEACEKNNIVHTTYLNDVVWSCGYRYK